MQPYTCIWFVLCSKYLSRDVAFHSQVEFVKTVRKFVALVHMYVVLQKVVSMNMSLLNL